MICARSTDIPFSSLSDVALSSSSSSNVPISIPSRFAIKRCKAFYGAEGASETYETCFALLGAKLAARFCAMPIQ